MGKFVEPRVGRPPKDKATKMGETFRCLGTVAVKQYWKQKAKELNITESQLLRMAIYGLIQPWLDAPLDDAMFDDIEK